MIRTNLLAILLVFATSAWAQEAPAPAEGPGEPISLLMFSTLGIVLLVAVALFLWFLRKRSNRAAAERVLNPNYPSNR
jgi:heme/copper-type cytochrome/quinol oxidase subunit 2